MVFSLILFFLTAQFIWSPQKISFCRAFLMTGTISENLLNIHDRIAKAAKRAGRDPGEVTIIAVTKMVEPKRIKEAISAGIRVVVETHVQGAQEKQGKV